MIESEFAKKLVEHIFKLLRQKEEDERIYGNSFVEFTDRKIEVVIPTEMMLKRNKKGIVINYSYEKEIIEKIVNKFEVDIDLKFNKRVIREIVIETIKAINSETSHNSRKIQSTQKLLETTFYKKFNNGKQK